MLRRGEIPTWDLRKSKMRMKVWRGENVRHARRRRGRLRRNGPSFSVLIYENFFAAACILNCLLFLCSRSKFWYVYLDATK